METSLDVARFAFDLTWVHLGTEDLIVDAGCYALEVNEAMKKPEGTIQDNVLPGYFCGRANAPPAAPATLEPVEFKHCKDVKVG